VLQRLRTAGGCRARRDAQQDATNIKIIGLGGGGCNTIARGLRRGIVGAELFACNTDAQHLLHITSPKKVLLGRRITKGLGAGALPQIGEEAAREAEEELPGDRPGSGYRLRDLRARRRDWHRELRIRRSPRERDGRPHDRGGHVTLPRGRQAPDGERGVGPREAPRRGGHCDHDSQTTSCSISSRGSR